MWLHADLHRANVLTADGALCGVIDFGDLRVGDPACDLAAGWILLPTDVVDRFRAAYRPAAHGAGGASGSAEAGGADAATWRRARGWTVIKALACLLIADAGDRGRASLQRLTATAAR